MARSPQQTTTTPVWNIFIIQGTDIATVDAAVLTKTKNLATLYSTPVSGQTAGTVVASSVIVDPVLVASVNNVASYTVSIRWQTESTPA